jgi:hypothetical protein
MSLVFKSTIKWRFHCIFCHIIVIKDVFHVLKNKSTYWYIYFNNLYYILHKEIKLYCFDLESLHIVSIKLRIPCGELNGILYHKILRFTQLHCVSQVLSSTSQTVNVMDHS